MSLSQTAEAFVTFSTNQRDVGIVNNILYSCKVTLFACTLYTWRVIVVQCFNCMHCTYVNLCIYLSMHIAMYVRT